MSKKQPAISVGEGLAIMANLGVVIGLIFVWAELRQNQTQLQAEVELSLASSYQTVLGRTAENPEVAEILRLSYTRPEDLSQDQSIRLMALHAEWMAIVYAAYALRQAGAINEETWLMHSGQYLLFLETEWMQKFWRGMLHEGMYPDGFIEELESRMPGLDQPGP